MSLSNAERQKLYRDRKKQEKLCSITALIPLELLEFLKAEQKQKNLTFNQTIAAIIKEVHYYRKYFKSETKPESELNPKTKTNVTSNGKKIIAAALE